MFPVYFTHYVTLFEPFQYADCKRAITYAIAPIEVSTFLYQKKLKFNIYKIVDK